MVTAYAYVRKGRASPSGGGGVASRNTGEMVQIEPKPRKYLVHCDRLQLSVEDLGDAGDVEFETGRERETVRK